ncbi:hypothetical protein QR98_0033080 [Sarcoptes scabiei]|uniref:Uncharacterized protein n=1 Tax=Sarcoptes scabiei TaxID=52283 RepID=A0A132A1P5_SARSC|nr:hypothetical protein QR98_0033080 [Sarcoptes scabiei]
MAREIKSSTIILDKQQQAMTHLLLINMNIIFYLFGHTNSLSYNHITMFEEKKVEKNSFLFASEGYVGQDRADSFYSRTRHTKMSITIII